MKRLFTSIIAFLMVAFFVNVSAQSDTFIYTSDDPNFPSETTNLVGTSRGGTTADLSFEGVQSTSVKWNENGYLYVAGGADNKIVVTAKATVTKIVFTSVADKEMNGTASVGTFTGGNVATWEGSLAEGESVYFANTSGVQWRIEKIEIFAEAAGEEGGEEEQTSVITLNFATIADSIIWNDRYLNRTLNFPEENCVVALNSFSRQTTTITTAPVAKAGNCVVTLNDETKSISAFKFYAMQWNNKAQTVKFYYSTDGTNFTEFEGPTLAFTKKTTSAEADVEVTDLPEGVRWIKAESQNASNQIAFMGIDLTIPAPASTGGDEPEEPEQPTGPTPAPVPTHDASKVIALYSNSYSYGAWNYLSPWGQTSAMEEVNLEGNTALHYTNVNYIGWTYNSDNIDVTTTNTLHLDIWSALSGKIKISPISQTPQREILYEIDIVENQWNQYDIPLTTWTAIEETAVAFNNIYQFKFDAQGYNPVLGDFYVDNVYFYNDGVNDPIGGVQIEEIELPAVAAPAPTKEAENVISIYSDAYTTEGWWNYCGSWGQTTYKEDKTIGADNVMLYREMNFFGMEYQSSAADLQIGDMQYLHLDIYAPAAGTVLVIPISREGSVGGKEISYGATQWTSLDIPVSELGFNETIVSLFQLKFDLFTASPKYFYVDNVYFWKEASTTPEDPVAPAAPVFSVEEGVFTQAFTLTITAEEGATIYYTLDGTEPTAESTTYQAGIEISVTTTVKAIAVKDDLTSAVTTAVYTLNSDEPVVEDIYNVHLYFKNIAGFADWKSNYVEHIVNYEAEGVKVTFTSANKQATNTAIDDMPVTKGKPVIVELTTAGKQISAAKLVAKQWATKAQTISLAVSKDGETYTTLDATSANFLYEDRALENGIKYIKYEFSTENQIGIDELHLFVEDDKSDVPTVARPRANAQAGDYYVAFDVELTAEEGASIYYTLDGSEPTTISTLYQGAINISTTTTLKAIAVKEGDATTGQLVSTVLSLVYNFPEVVDVENIAAFNALADAEKDVRITGSVTVVYSAGAYTYITDESGWLLVYGDVNDQIKSQNLVNGNVLTGIIGNYAPYKGLREMKPVYVPTATEGTAVEPLEMTMAQVAALDLDKDQSKFIKVSGYAKDDAELNNKGGQFVLKSGANEVTVYNSTKLCEATLSKNGGVDVYAFVYVYDAIQLLPIRIEENVEAAVNNAVVANANVYGMNGNVYVEAQAGATINVYSVNGMTLRSVKSTSNVTTLSGLSGIVIVTVDNQAYKLIVK